MNLNDYFDSIVLKEIERDYLKSKNQLYNNVKIHDQNNLIANIEDFDIAILGVVDDSINNNDSQKGLQLIREYLYSLKSYEKSTKIIDLGNFKLGKTDNDSLIGLRDVFVELIISNTLPVIIGPSELISYANYLAYEKLDKQANLVSIDSVIRIYENREEELKSSLWKILIEKNEALFSFTNLGYQSHFVSNNILKYLSDNLHYANRLGNIRSDIKGVEPIFRDADSIGLNISAIRQSDAFGQLNPSPNGFTGEEICQLAQYSGMSNKLNFFGIYDYNLSCDINNQTAHLVAQIMWYFINGINNRISEYPLDESSSNKKFIVNLDTFEYEIIFYKSENTERWWMEVPSFKSKSSKNLLISCTYDDYQNACNGDVPERWLKAFQKIN